MRRVIANAAVALASAAFLVACGDNHPLPTAPARPGDAAGVFTTIAQNGCYNETGGATPFSQVDPRVKNLINALFIGDNLQSSLSMWENLKKDKLDGQPIQSHIDNIAKFTLNQLGIGGLQDPGFTLDPPEGGLNATTGAVRLLDLIFTCANLTPTSLPDPPAGFDGTFVLVDASDSDTPQQFNTSFKDAGAVVKGKSLSARTMLVIARQPATVEVNTPFRQLSRTIDVAFAGGKLKENEKFTVLVCARAEFPDVDEVTHRALIAHQRIPRKDGDPVGTGVEYLVPSTQGALDCPASADVGEAWRMEKGFFRQRGMQLASLVRKALNFIGPRPLYAGHAAIGGDMGFTSPVVLVDAYVGTELSVDPVSQTTYGENVTVDATLKITSGPAAWIGQPVTQALPGMPPLGTPLQVSVTVDDANGTAHSSQTQALPVDAAGKVHYSFSHENASTTHNAQVSFTQTQNLPANAPVFMASGDNDNAFVVQPANLDITPNANGREYGYQDDAAHLDHPFDGSVDGLQYGDVINADYESSANIESEINARGGPYDVHVKNGSVQPVGTALLSNYDIHPATADFTIRPRHLQGTTENATRVYGEPNPAFTSVATNASSSGSGTIANPVPFNDGVAVTFATAAGVTAPVTPASGLTDPNDSRWIVPSLSGDKAPNYVNDVTKGTLLITPRALVGGPTPETNTAVYGDAIPVFGTDALHADIGGTPQPALVADGVTAEFKAVKDAPDNGDVVQGTGKGLYTVRLRLIGDAAANYDVSRVGTGSLEITAAPLSFTASDITREYGNANPVLRTQLGAADGVKNGDAVYVLNTVIASYDATTDANTYVDAVVASLDGDYPNYFVQSSVAGVLHITQAPLSFAIDAGGSHVYGEANHFSHSEISGVKNGDVLTVGYDPAESAVLDVGSHAIHGTLSGEKLANYSYTEPTSELVIVPPPPVLSSDVISLTPNEITGGTSSTIAFTLPALTSVPSSASSVSLRVSGCGEGSVTKTGGGAVGAADLGATISVDAPVSSATDNKTCTYTLTVANSASTPVTATATGTLSIVPATVPQ